MISSKIKHTQKSLVFITLSLFSMQQEVSAGNAGFLKRCKDDSLNQRDAKERVEWAYRCDHINDFQRDLALFDDDGDELRRPLYPIFVDPNDGEVWDSAPTNRFDSCYKPKWFKTALLHRRGVAIRYSNYLKLNEKSICC